MNDFLMINHATASRSLTLLDRFMSAPVVGAAARTRIPRDGGPPRPVARVISAAHRSHHEYQLVALMGLF